MSGVVYLDYAATAAVRPEPVVEAVAAYLRDVGATPGRATHSRSLAAGRILLRCRRALAELFGIEGDPGRIAFQLNATHALNSALFGLLRAGDVVVRTQYDHNSVRRPIAALRAHGVQERVLTGRTDGGLDWAEVDEQLRGAGKPARLVVIPHASNVLGSVSPVEEVTRRAHEVGALVLLDAAQTAGHYPVDVARLGVDLVAFTGHKGLLGPQGTGGLWVREGVEVRPLLWGGTGGDSYPLEMPEAFPDRLEAGTQNGPGIAGLLAGVEWIAERGLQRLREQELRHREELIRRLGEIPDVEIRSPTATEGVGIVTITARTRSPSDLAAALEREYGVLTRAGLHCAPEAHGVIGTTQSGAVRFSVGWATTNLDIQRAADAVRELVERA